MGRFGGEGWGFVCALVAVGVAFLDPDPTRRGLTVLGCAAVAVALGVRAARTLDRELGALGHAVERLSRGDLDTPIPTADRVRGVASRLELARRAVATRLQRAEHQRDGLAEFLAFTDARLRDPAGETRRERLARSGPIRVALKVGSEVAEAALVDLTPDQVVLAVAERAAERLVPGLPVTVRIHVGDAHFGALALAVGPAPVHGGTAWVIRFAEPLDPERLPGELGRALVTRASDRVRPTRALPATATLLAPFGAVPAEVADVSEGGVGLLVTLDPAHLGDLERSLVLRLTFPTLGRMAVLEAELCNVTFGERATRLGLRFVGEQRTERAKVAEFLRTSADAADGRVVH